MPTFSSIHFEKILQTLRIILNFCISIVLLVLNVAICALSLTIDRVYRSGLHLKYIIYKYDIDNINI